jgi:hypothetical protein
MPTQGATDSAPSYAFCGALIGLIVAVVLMIGFVLYRSRSGRNLNVDPHARQEIGKAKRL